jgi:hypothetical protein
MARVTGVGGVFFTSTGDPTALAAWYAKHLGLVLEAWGGAILRWPGDSTVHGGATVWTVAEPGTEWFSPAARAS